MRALFCPLASHGFVYPAIAVARALAGSGHTVAFVTGQAFKETLGDLELERIPRGARDGASFQAETWHHSLSIAMQVKHIEYALERFAPDVLVSHPLSLGALIVRERVGVPLAVLGLATHLWPVSEELVVDPPESETDRRLVWRHVDMMRHFNNARALFKLAPCVANHRESPMLGDVFMLQSVPELGVDIEGFPEHAHLVGACLWEPPAEGELKRWLAEAVALATPLIYVHHGRSFTSPSFWPHVTGALGDRPLRVVAAIGRMNAERGPTPANFFVRDHICQGAVLEHARAVITGGNTTPVLGALTHGVPCLVLPGGGEQAELADLVARTGTGRVLPLAEANAETVGRAVEELLRDAELTRRVEAIERAFASFDGPARAARLIELLAEKRSRVTRRDAASAAGGPWP